MLHSKGELPVIISHETTTPGDHILMIRLITSSGTFTDTILYTTPNGNLEH